MSNILVIGDLHAPAIHPKALDFVSDVLDLYDIDQVVMTGDLLDSHSLSRFTRNPDSPLGSYELELSIEQLKDWYKLIPNAKVCIGNHDERYMLRASESGISRRFIKDFASVIEAPEDWEFKERHIIGNVLFTHGTGVSGNAWRLLAERQRMSCVIGHLHSQFGITYTASTKDLLFNMVVGCLVDNNHPYMSYGKNILHKPILGVGLILDGNPNLLPMDL